MTPRCCSRCVEVRGWSEDGSRPSTTDRPTSSTLATLTWTNASTSTETADWLTSLVVLLAALGIELPQLVNLAGNLTPLIGLPSFEVPALALPGWANVALILLAGAAGLERSLSLKYHPLLDD